MTDPVSLGLGIAGVVGPALHVSRLLLNDLRDIKDAPKNITALTDTIDSLTRALTSVESIPDGEWASLGPSVIEDAKSTITQSTATCKRFNEDIEQWTHRSQDGSLSWLNRSKIGFFKKAQMKSMSGEIQTCYTKITSVVSTATLLKTIHQGHVTDEIRQSIESQKEGLVKASQAAEAERAHIGQGLSALTLQYADDDEEDDDVDYRDTLKQLREQQKTLEAAQKLLKELLAKVHESTPAAAASTHVSIGSVTFGAQNSGIQLGSNHGPITWNPK